MREPKENARVMLQPGIKSRVLREPRENARVMLQPGKKQRHRAAPRQGDATRPAKGGRQGQPHGRESGNGAKAVCRVRACFSMRAGHREDQGYAPRAIGGPTKTQDSGWEEGRGKEKEKDRDPHRRPPLTGDPSGCGRVSGMVPMPGAYSLRGTTGRKAWRELNSLHVTRRQS